MPLRNLLTEVGRLAVHPVVEGVVEVLHQLGHLVGRRRVGRVDTALHVGLPVKTRQL